MGQQLWIMFRIIIRMQRKRDLIGFNQGLVVCARQAGFSVSVTADLLGFSCTAFSRGYAEKKFCVGNWLVDKIWFELKGRLQ